MRQAARRFTMCVTPIRTKQSEGLMFQKLGQKFQRFMIGRNGPDNLARFSLFIAFLFMVVGLFVREPIVNQVITVLAFAAIGYCYFRIFSRKVANRYKENRKYVSISSKLTAPFRRQYSHAKEWMTHHKTHRIYTCKKCGQSLRVPKGKGTVKVTCPKCKESFTAKS